MLSRRSAGDWRRDMQLQSHLRPGHDGGRSRSACAPALSSPGSPRLAQRYFHTTGKIVGAAWQLATGADLTLPEVEGTRPQPVRIANKYVQQVQAAAEHDIVVAERLSSVIGLIEPPSRLMHPAVIARVAKASLGRRLDKTTAAPARVSAGAS